MCLSVCMCASVAYKNERLCLCACAVGLLVRVVFPLFQPVKDESLFDDEPYWNVSTLLTT